MTDRGVARHLLACFRYYLDVLRPGPLGRKNLIVPQPVVKMSDRRQ